MIAKNLIRTTLTPLKPSDTGIFALRQMSDNHVRHLPVVDGLLFIGLLAEDDILHSNPELNVELYRYAMARPFAYESDHLYEIMHKMGQFRLTVIPVVDEMENYLGSITLEDLLPTFTDAAYLNENGSIIVLEAAPHDYSLAEIARIVEAENAQILSYFITTPTENTEVEITLKLNRTEVGSIIAALQRFDYHIKGSYASSDYEEDLQERYDAFLSYLNV
jgi:acetoin utilization protein AcuB